MKNLKLVKEKIRQNQKIVITCHINPDGDAIGSMLALGLGLYQMDKDVTMVCKDPIPQGYRTLPGVNKIQKSLGRKKYDLAITVDCNSPNILGVDLSLLQKTKDIIEIDHHDFREPFGTISMLDIQAAANGEMIYVLLKSLKIKITEEIAQNILTSLIVETNSFRLPQTRALTFEICAELMKTGVDFTKLTNTVYWAQRKESVIMTGVSLSRCRFLSNGEIAWSIIRLKDFKENHGLNEDVDAVPDIMRSIQRVKASVFFREQYLGILRVSLRSKGGINIAKIAKEYGGGGHYDVAGCFIENNQRAIDGLLKKILQLIHG